MSALPPDDKTPESVDLSDAKDVTPQAAPVMSDLQKAGVNLAWGVLISIATIAVLLIALIATGEYLHPPSEVATVQILVQQASAHYAAASSPDTLKEANDLLTRLSESRRASRDFWISLAQLLLLNLLLPVLTAILGYIFGTMKNGQS